MYIKETNILYYAIVAIIGLFVGMLIDWMNKRLPENKKVFSKEIFKEYLSDFKPNYVIMTITAIIYIALIAATGFIADTGYPKIRVD